MAHPATHHEVFAERSALCGRLAKLLPRARPDSILALSQKARFRTVAPGEPFYEQDDPVRLTLIQSGHAISRRTTPDGQPMMRGAGGPGALFGFSALTETRSSVDILAVSECEVVQWSGDVLEPIFARDPGLCLDAIDSLAGSLHQMIESTEGFLHQDARRRVLRILARYRELFFCKPAVLNRSHLPGLVGTTREMTGRVLRQLEREGTLARVGRTGLELLRPDRLGEHAGRA